MLSSPVPWKALVSIFFNVLANLLSAALPAGGVDSLGAGSACVKVFSKVVPLKAFWPILVTVLGKLTVARLAAPLKVEVLIVVICVFDKSREVMPEP